MLTSPNLTLSWEIASTIGLNLSSAELQRHMELSHRPMKICIISVLGALIILGNVAVILVIASSVSGWSRNTRYFLISLTGADAALALVVMPLNLYVSLVKDREDPDPYCHAVAFFNSTVYATCIYSLATISLERRQRHKLKNRDLRGRSRPDSASRVLVPVMIVYYTCWTPCMMTILYTAISGTAVPEWLEFVAVWLPSANGFLNCIVYFWINHSFRRKFCLMGHRLCLQLCPAVGKVGGYRAPGGVSVVGSAWDNNNSLQERSCSVSSNCTLLPQVVESCI
nr:PREDICTED: melatonin receptor type 1B-B-like isoform X3 [Lepisosteus oculatus]